MYSVYDTLTVYLVSACAGIFLYTPPPQFPSTEIAIVMSMDIELSFNNTLISLYAS